MKFEQLTITPEKAREMLDKSNGNPRYSMAKEKYNRDRVALYAREMRAGKWQLTAQPIIFDDLGVLVDGHHRLHAVIAAGVPVTMTVVYGQPHTTYMVDRGQGRTEAQVIGTANWVVGMLNVANAMVKDADCVDVYNEHVNYLASEKVEIIRKHSAQLETIQTLRNKTIMKKRLLAKAGTDAAFFFALLAGVPAGILEEFADKVTTGEARPEETATTVLRNYLILGDGAKSPKRLCAIAQNAIYDFVNYVPRKQLYRKPEAVYTKKWAEQGGRLL